MRRPRLLPPGPLMVPLALLLAQAWLPAARAQTEPQAQARNLTLSAGIDTRVGYIVNSRLGGLDAAEWIGEVTPSISLQSRSGRLVGSFDYGLNLVQRSRREPSGEAANRLSAQFSAEAVPGHLYLDASASIVQQSTSPFGLQSAVDSSSVNPNRREVASAALSPVLRGVIGGSIVAEARLNAATADTRDTQVGDNTQVGGSLSLSSLFPGTLVSWGLAAQSTETEFRIGRDTRSESATATLGWQADADLSLSLRGGTERQNLQEQDSQRTGTWGVGVNWRPSPRTRLQANVDERFFGRGYGLVAEYRLPRTSVTWNSTRDTSNRGGGSVEPISQFQLFMGLLANEIPDPAQRETVVRSQLAQLGIDPLTVARPGFVISSVSVTERHSLGWAWSGLRLSFGAQASRSTVTAIDTALSAVEREAVRQGGYSANVSYRLTPTSNLLAIGSRQMTRATATRAANDLKSASLTWTEQIGRRTNASLSARYTVFNSTIDPYREAALTASMVMRF